MSIDNTPSSFFLIDCKSNFVHVVYIFGLNVVLQHHLFQIIKLSLQLLRGSVLNSNSIDRSWAYTSKLRMSTKEALNPLVSDIVILYQLYVIIIDIFDASFSNFFGHLK